MTKASRDTQTRRRERKGRRKEREGKERKRTGVPSYAQASRDTPVRERGEPEYYIQERPKMTKKGREEGRGTPMSCGHVRCAWLLRPLRSRKGMSQLGIQDVRQKSEFSWPRPPTLAASCSGPGRRDKTNPPSTGPREALCGLIPGWREARHTYDWVY